MKKLLLCLLCVLGVSVGIAGAQTGSIMGRVVDPIGAGIGFGAGVEGRVAAGRAQSAQAGTIAGTVVAREDRQAVAEAVVVIEGTSLTAITNAIGRFRIENVPPGDVVLIVQASGFLELRVPSLQIRPNETTPLIVELEVTPNFLERVQVTATKTSLSIGDLAASADTVDRATIDRRGDQALTQAIAHVPGVVIATQLGLFESVLLRGMPRVGNEFTNTLLLIDGVPQTNSGNDARVVALPINDARSIEVVRGPNSALYGRTAIGGTINVLTADPTPDPQVGFEFTGGEFGTAKGIFHASGPLEQWGGYYVSVASERHGGYFENKTTSDFVVGNSALFAKLRFVPDGQSFGTVSVNRVISDNSTPTNEPVVNGRLLHEIDPRFDRLTNFNIPGRNYHQEEGRVTFNYTRALLPQARVVGVFGYRAVQLKFLDDGDFIGAPYDLAANTLTMYPFSQQADEDVYYSEARLEATPQWGRAAHSLILGGSYERNNGALATDFIFNDPALFGFTINYLNPVIPSRTDWQHDTSSRTYHLGITALFAQYMIEPTPRLILTAGGRYDRLNLDVTRLGQAQVEDTFDAFSPKASATFKLLGVDGAGQATLNVYGAYSQSFLPPRRPSSLVPADVPLNLQPEDIDNYEGGLKGSLLDGQVSFEATAFRMTEDGVVLTTRQGAFFLPTNAGERKFKGFETAVGWQMSPQLSAYVNGLVYRHRFGDFVIQSAGGDTDLEGNRLRISPDYVVNWGFTFAPVPFIDAGFDVKHVSDVMADQNNTFKLDSYTLVDAAVSWRRGPLRFTLSAHNLFNEEYYFNGSDESADPGRPRQVLLTTSVRFR